MGKISTMLFIYDKEGTIIATHNANNCVPPVGVPWVVADIPDGCIVEKIDVITQKPVYAMVEDTITDLDKLSANVLYTMMMMDLKSPSSELAVAREVSVHSNDYDDIRKYYMNHLWDMKAVRQAVVHGLITQEEYTDILKEYEAKYSVDTEHDIPSVDVG